MESLNSWTLLYLCSLTHSLTRIDSNFVDVYEVIYASSVFYELFELSSVIYYASVFDDD
jgi:hypothetical protein